MLKFTESNMSVNLPIVTEQGVVTGQVMRAIIH